MNALDKSTFKKYIQAYDFTTLFNELGWDYLNEDLPKKAGDKTFSLKAVAHKEGFRIFVCNPDEEGKIPDSSLRKKIHTEISRLYFEHLIIFIDRDKTTQLWQLVIREHGKPQRIKQVTWYRHQEPELLYQRLSGAFFTIDETDKLTIVDVTHRLKENFGANAEKVTKKFYDGFKKEHTAFLEFITGVTDKVDREWYASLMLNRLMFIYFIQRKGFLDNDKDYLRNRLKTTQEKRGKDKFYSFYRNFLLVLFHKGLGSFERTPELIREIGIVPYLNGGLFDVHNIEENYPNIQIVDNAFEKIFDFFDEFNWHLDTRITATGKDINPDVIGYIFEKYINDRAAMGAYYTKEDITEYISKNCVIPFLFGEVKRNYPKALKPDSDVWNILKEDPDKYIYDAVRHGSQVEKLPPQIEAGINNVSARTEWNKPAPQEYALPTEIWREVVERRRRYHEVKSKIKGSGIAEINDFITYNLNIRQFAQDVIENTDAPDLIKHFYKAIRNITVLDPTCGSGAFLFAALNILEPLYESCIQRMESYVNESSKGKYKFFEETLADVKSDKHPNLQYFIYKTIILNNLYGVDIMKEAAETAKLRLFLKLVAEIDKVDQIEPLPDIDFNIRSGNTLVGFAALKDVERAVEGHLLNSQLLKKEIEDIKEQAEIVKMAYENFKNSQMMIDSPSTRGAKTDLENRLQKLNDKLNIYKAQLYGIDMEKKPQEYEKWKSSHQPFHWFAEFYEIVHEKGGFDVIIGNPPFLEMRDVNYTPHNFRCIDSNTVHAMCVEQSLRLLRNDGYVSMIFPMSIVSTQRMKILQTLLEEKRDLWYANYAWRPAKLFDTVNRALTIFIAAPLKNNHAFSTGYQKWTSDNRDLLMATIDYIKVPRGRPYFWMPKMGHHIERSILEKMLNITSLLSRYFASNGHKVYYRTTGGLYWKVFTDFSPLFKVQGRAGHSTRETWFTLNNGKLVKSAIAVLSSDLFWWWYTITTTCRDLNPYDIQNFPIPETILDDQELHGLGEKYLNDLQRNSTMMVRVQKQTGHTETQSFKIQKSKPIIDEIDRVLAKHYGFTDEELDFIINYDIKYRMGKGAEGEDADAE